MVNLECDTMNLLGLLHNYNFDHTQDQQQIVYTLFEIIKLQNTQNNSVQLVNEPLLAAGISDDNALG